MLKGISPLLSPGLLKALCEMGHSDQVLIADGNFPAASMGRENLVIRMDGHGVTEILRAILSVFPLDTYCEKPVQLMEKVEGDQTETAIWEEFVEEILRVDERGRDAIGHTERFAFYEKAKKAYVIIATSEKALYANVLLQKGVV